jgi:hypothetical protein
MADPKQSDAQEQQRTLDLIVSTGVSVISSLLPSWKPPKLEHPYAEKYASGFKLHYELEDGDQIMVQASSGYWHHAIFVGQQRFVNSKGHDVYVPAVVDFWGPGDKETANIDVRAFSDFEAGAHGWAKAKYPEGMAVDAEMSAKVALAYVEYVKKHPNKYHVVQRNCEVFATFCRCLRSVSADVLASHIALGAAVLACPRPLEARKHGFK